MAQARKMVNLKIEETSGVDHPAHEHEGWIVMKSASAESVEGLFGSLNKQEEAPVADTEKTPEELLAEKDARIAELEAQAAAAPAAAPAAQEPAADAEGEDEGSLEKALDKLPAAVRKALAKQADDLAAAQATIAKERDARLDGEAITKSREVYKSIAIDHEAVAPALRRMAVLDADLTKAVETALAAADAQLSAGTGITKEVGHTGSGSEGSALENIKKAATALQEGDTSLTDSQAFVKALEANPELHAAYIAEKAGK